MDENQIYYLGRVEKNTIVLKQNSNRLTAYARGTYNELKINANGYASLAKNDIDLSECKFATMVNYVNINPKTVITIYASSRRAYILGEPDTIIYGLEVDFWK